MSIVRRTALRPVKRLVALTKHASLAGDASVHWRASVRGPGRLLLDEDARVADGAAVDLRGGSVRLGPRSVLSRGALVRASGAVLTGADCAIMHYSIIYGEGDVTLGDRVLIGNHCLIASTTHVHADRAPIVEQGMRQAPIIIGNDVWIGAYCLIDPGVTIGEGAIVGAYSYVREDVPPFAVIGGVPGRVLKMRAG